MVKWININEQKPKVGDIVICKVEFWRFGALSHTMEMQAEYIGWNDITKQPMFDIDTYGMSYATVKYWGVNK